MSEQGPSSGADRCREAARNPLRPPPGRWLPAALSAALALSAGSAAGAEASPAIVGLRVGFDGRFKLGCWTPVEVTLRGGGRDVAGQLELIVSDGDGVPTRVRGDQAAHERLGAGRIARVLLYARFGRLDGDLTVVFRASDGLAVSRTFGSTPGPDGIKLPRAIATSQQLIVAVGPSIGVEEAIAQRGGGGAERIILARLDDTGHLPTRWYGYEGVDTLILSAGGPGVYDQLQAAGPRQQALEEWLRLGGKLVVSAGAEAPALLVPGGALARFAPGEFAGMITLRRTAALETYSGTSYRVPRVGRGGQRDGLPVCRLRNVAGVIEAQEPDLPLVVRAPRAFGEIVFVPFDLARAPWADWPARGQFVSRLLGGAGRGAEEGGELAEGASAARVGITDLAGQLRGALDQFEGVEPFPFWAIAVLASLYILCIGPGDYFLLKKVLRRMELTWLTFPASLLLFGAVAYWLAHGTKGDKLRVNQVDLVDVDIQSGLVRGTSWLNLFSPSASTYNLTLEPKLQGGTVPARSEVLLSWLGLPGPGLGGMEPLAPPLTLVSLAYDFSPRLDALVGVPIEVWSTKSFVARWHDANPAASGLDVSGDLVSAIGIDQAEGTVTSHLDFKLSDCLLVHGRWAWLVGELEPGETVRIEPGEQRELQPLLKDHRLALDKKRRGYVSQTTPYDPASFDVPTILRQMMFYEAVGGQHYTQLWNRYQGFADLSRHLGLGRAILVGMGERPGAEVRHDQRPLAAGERRWSFYRFVLPVEQQAAGGEAPGERSRK